MPVEIGKSPVSFHHNPFRHLSECHRRIERFLYVIITVKREAQGGPLDHRQRHALKTSLNYFREAAPMHTLDEEESLFPRMRIVGGEETDMIDGLTGLELEHAVVQVTHNEMDRLGRRWLDEGSLIPEELARFTQLLSKLSIVYHRHIHEEETSILPNAEKLLREPDIREIGREMAMRRNIPIVEEAAGKVC